MILKQDTRMIKSSTDDEALITEPMIHLQVINAFFNFLFLDNHIIYIYIYMSRFAPCQFDPQLEVIIFVAQISNQFHL